MSTLRWDEQTASKALIESTSRSEVGERAQQHLGLRTIAVRWSGGLIAQQQLWLRDWYAMLGVVARRTLTVDTTKEPELRTRPLCLRQQNSSWRGRRCRLQIR